MWSIPEEYIGKRVNLGLKIPAPGGQFAGIVGTLKQIIPGAHILTTDNRKDMLIPNDMVVHVELGAGDKSEIQVVSGNVLQKHPRQ